MPFLEDMLVPWRVCPSTERTIVSFWFNFTKLHKVPKVSDAQQCGRSRWEWEEYGLVAPTSRNGHQDNTLPKTNIAPENRPSQKETRKYSNHPFFRCYVSFQAGYVTLEYISRCRNHTKLQSNLSDITWQITMILSSLPHILEVLVSSHPLPTWCSWTCRFKCEGTTRTGFFIKYMWGPMFRQEHNLKKGGWPLL